MSDTSIPNCSRTASASPDLDYRDGVARILGEVQASVASVVAAALCQHAALTSSIMARRLAEPLLDTAGLAENPTVTRRVSADVRIPSTGHGHPTARELVLEAVALAIEPISFADVKLAVVAAGGSESAAHKVRTDLLRKGAIINRRGLYSITEVGREMRAAYG